MRHRRSGPLSQVMKSASFWARLFLTLSWSRSVRSNFEDFNCDQTSSCQGACGHNFLGQNMTCSCDSDCQLFNDCCMDYNDLCEGGMVPKFVHTHGEVKCLDLDPSHDKNYGLYGIARCPDTCTEALEATLCDTMSFNPVSNESVWYKNEKCLHCWEESSNSSTVMAKLRMQDRPCVRGLANSSRVNFQNVFLKEACETYLDPILHFNGSVQAAYRNVHCLMAVNDNISLDGLSCFPPKRPDVPFHWSLVSKAVSPITRSTRGDEFDEIYYDSVKQNTFNYNLPPSISVMINFGYKNKHVMYSAENWIHGCSEYEIWDPYSEVCREVYCASNFDLVDFECIGDSVGNASDSDSPVWVALPSPEVFVNVTALAGFIDNSTANFPVHNMVDFVRDSFVAKMTSYFGLSEDRITNVTVLFRDHRFLATFENITENVSKSVFNLMGAHEAYYSLTEILDIINRLDWEKDVLELEITFVLWERNNDQLYEYETDDVIAYMAEFVSDNSFQLTIDPVVLQITSMHESTFYTETQLFDWCRGGHLNTYNHEQLNITVTETSNHNLSSSKSYSGWDMEIQVLESGHVYSNGEFVANLIFHGVHDDNVCNFTGVVKICENRAQINDTSCPRMKFGFDEFIWNQDCSDNKINFTGNRESREKFGIVNPVYEWQYTVKDDGVVMCIWIPPFIFPDPVEAWLSFISLILSTAGLFAAFVTYTIFSDLRNLPGLNLMALILTILLYQLIFLTLVNPQTAANRGLCKAVGVSEHFLVLSSFFWCNVMAWDIYQTFGQRSMFSSVKPKSYFFNYASYVYLVTFIIMSVAVLVEFSQLIPNFELGYGDYSCWIGNTYAAMIFLAIPLILVLVVNTCLFVKTMKSISHVSRLIRRARAARNGRRDLGVYIRIAIILGFTWIFGILTILIPSDASGFWLALLKILVYLHVVFNGSIGLFIFAAFIANKRVWKLYKGLFYRLKCGSKSANQVGQAYETKQGQTDANSDDPDVHLPAPNPEGTDQDDIWFIRSLDNDNGVPRQRKPSGQSNHSNLTVSTSLGSMSISQSSRIKHDSSRATLDDIEEDSGELRSTTDSMKRK